MPPPPASANHRPQSTDKVIEIFSSDDEKPNIACRRALGPSRIQAQPATNIPSQSPHKTRRRPRVIYSSDEDENVPAMAPPKVIELSDSSDSFSPPMKQKAKKSSNAKMASPPPPQTPARKTVSLYASDSDDDNACNTDDSDASLPRFISKGLKRPAHLQKASTLPSIPKTPAKLKPSGSLQADPTPAFLRTYTTATASRPTSLTPCTPQTTRIVPKTPRTSKKALAQANQAHRAAYAQELFDELNREVFNDGLPVHTTLVWSSRLLSTAGRARWHRAKDKTETSEVELAIKILDSEERIRNTLSHEMCHLACWIINRDPKEGHGPAWKSWAAKVTRKRPDIKISTRHDYEISYPFQWECSNCCKIYGRFSKSIRADEVLCGACKTGRLEALFTTRARTNKAPKAGSKHPSGNTQGSPLSSARTSDERNSDLEVLAMTVGGLRLED